MAVSPWRERHFQVLLALVGHCWGYVGLSWRHAGTILAHVAAHVTICWSHVGAWLPDVGPRPCHVGGLCWAHVGPIYVAPKLANVVAMLAMLRQNSFSQKRPFRLGESDILRFVCPSWGHDVPLLGLHWPMLAHVGAILGHVGVTLGLQVGSET